MGKATNRPKVKSKKTKVPKLDWGESDKNISTLKRLEKVIDEKILKKK